MDSVAMRDGAPGGRAADQGGKKGISGSTVKIIAVITMLIDHIAAAVLTRQIFANGYLGIVNGTQAQITAWLEENGTLYYGMRAMRMIGRMAFPIFCFLLVEGFQRTRDVKKYALRLGIFALISEIPFNLAVTGRFFHAGYQNVYFTLLFSLLALWGYAFFDNCEKREEGDLPGIWRGFLTVTGVLASGSLAAVFLSAYPLWENPSAKLAVVGVVCAVVAAACVVYGRKRGFRRIQTVCADITVLTAAIFLAEAVNTDYGGMGVLAVTAMYVFRKRRVVSVLVGCLVLAMLTSSEIPAVLAAVPIAVYNGRRGLKMKYFFYAFYPVHLFLLYLISVLMGLGSIVLL